jgi:protoheme IX farnesyltransferase
MRHVKPYLILCRAYVSLFAACSAATGFFLFSYHRIFDVFGTAASVFLLACGSSALNQYQERDIDAKMERTRERPLPSGAITPAVALSSSAALLIAGEFLLACFGGSKSFVLGLAALLWYNGIYTYLKRVTAFASVPGALVGIIPPAIGWVAAGGAISDGRLIAICFVFFLWQVPHFWLLVLRHGEEYERAGLPSLTRLMKKPQIARITFVWIIASAIASLALPLYGSVKSPLIFCSFIPLAVWLIWSERALFAKRPLLPPSTVLFRNINIYLFLIMSLLSVDNILFHTL